MKRSDIQSGVEYAKQAPGSRRSPERVRVVDTAVRAKPGRWDNRTGIPTADFPIVSTGLGILVQEWDYHAEDFGRYVIVQTSHLARTWAEQIEADERGRVVREQHRAAEAERTAAHATEVAVLTEQAQSLGLTVGTGWASDADILSPDSASDRYEITADALGRLLEMAASAPRSVTALEG